MKHSYRKPAWKPRLMIIRGKWAIGNGMFRHRFDTLFSPAENDRLVKAQAWVDRANRTGWRP